MIESERPCIWLLNYKGRVRIIAGHTVTFIIIFQKNNHLCTYHIRVKPEILSSFRIEIDHWIVAIKFHLRKELFVVKIALGKGPCRHIVNFENKNYRKEEW